MFQTNTLSEYVTEFDLRKEALRQAMAYSNQDNTTGEVVETAETFYKFLKGTATRVRPDPRDPQS